MKLSNLKHDNSLSEKVYQQLFKSLLKGKLHPGQKITESELAQSMGISRSPIREAMKRLAKDHLIVLVPRSGCYVADLTEKEIHEIYEIRLRLECMALEHAFDKLRSDPQLLIPLMEEFKNCIGKTDDDLINSELRLDTKLHDLIMKQSKCSNLQEMLENLRTRLEIFRQQSTATCQRAADALNEHLRIIQSILDGDKHQSLDHLKIHIEHTKQNVLTNLKSKVAPK